MGGKISVQLSQPEFRAQYTHSSANQQSAQTCNAFHKVENMIILDLIRIEMFSMPSAKKATNFFLHPNATLKPHYTGKTIVGWSFRCKLSTRVILKTVQTLGLGVLKLVYLCWSCKIARGLQKVVACD